jgi:transposase
MRGNLGLFVSAADRARLAAIVADRKRPQKHVWRAKVLLLSADQHGTAEIMRRPGLSKPSVWRWQERYIEAGIDGRLRDPTRPSRVSPLANAEVAEVIQRTLEEAAPGEATHWTRAVHGTRERRVLGQGASDLAGGRPGAAPHAALQAVHRPGIRS